MKLYELPWAIHPRRLGIYLTEKGLDGEDSIERIQVSFPQDRSKRILQGVTRAGTVPALDTGDGLIIGCSIPIMEYLEERFPTPTMLGETPSARARTREFAVVAEEASIHMGAWVYNGSRLFAGQPQSNAAARAGMATFHATLRLLDGMAADLHGEFLAGDTATIADCIAFSMLQTAKEFFGVPIPDVCPQLEAWYARFALRPSGAVPQYPPVVNVARGLPEQTMNP